MLHATNFLPQQIPSSTIYVIINQPPSTIGDTFSMISPQFGSAFKQTPGLNAPINMHRARPELEAAAQQQNTDTSKVFVIIFKHAIVSPQNPEPLPGIIKVLLSLDGNGALDGLGSKIPNSKTDFCFFNLLSNLNYFMFLCLNSCYIHYQQQSITKW